MMLGITRLALPVCFFLFVPALLEQFEAPKATALRVLGTAGLAAGLFSLRAFRWRLGAVDAAVLAWVAVEILATVFADSPRISFLGEPEQREGLQTSISLAGLYLAARIGSRSASDVRGTLDVALASATIASAYAISQTVGLDPVHWTRTSAFGAMSIRPFGTFGHPNLMGLVGAAAASAALAMLLLHPERRLYYAIIGAISTVATLLTLSRGAWLGIAAGMLTSGVLAWRTGAARAIPARTRWLAAAVLVAALTGVILTVGLPLGKLVRERFDTLIAGGSLGRLEIWYSALAAWRARPFLGHGPDSFTMIFPRYQTAAYWRYEWTGLPFHAHSIYLHTLATRGALGAAAMGGGLAALALAARSAWRAGREASRLVPALAGALCAIAVAGAFGSLGVSGTVFAVVIAAGFGTLATFPADGSASALSESRPAEAVAHEASARSALHAANREGPGGGRSRGSDSGARRVDGARPDAAHDGAAARAGRHGPLLAGALTGLVMLVWGGADLTASYYDRRGLDLMQLSNRSSDQVKLAARRAAVRAYETAKRLMPFEDAVFRRSGESLRYLAAVESDSLSILAEAERQARRAVAMAPLRSLNHRYLGLILLSRVKRGDAASLAEGEAEYARALALAPNDALVIIELAKLEIDLGRARVALEPASRVAALYPEKADPHVVLAAAHLALRETALARSALEQALGEDWQGNEEARRQAELTLKGLPAQ